MISAQGIRLPTDKAITSTENPIFRDLIECQLTKGIKKHGLYMVFGERAIKECLGRNPEMARSLVVPDGDFEVSYEINQLVVKRRQLNSEFRFSILGFSRPLFKELDLFGTGSAILIMMPPALPTADLTAKPVGLEICCALGDPSNLGAFLRSAAAFRADKIVLLKECASPFHPKAVRAASAATTATALAVGPSIHELPAQGETYALDMEGSAIDSFKWPQNVRLLVGEEGPGIPKSLGIKKLKIPIAAGVESLNAAVAVSIALFSYRSQLDRHVQSDLIG